MSLSNVTHTWKLFCMLSYNKLYMLAGMVSQWVVMETIFFPRGTAGAVTTH